MTFLLLPLITTFLYYLGSGAGITLRIRSQLPDPVNAFLSCPACAGFWYGLALGVYLYARGLTTLPPELAIVGIAAASSVWTPMISALFLQALEVVSSTYEPDVEEEEEYIAVQDE